MVFQIAALVMLPIAMLLVADSSFDEPIQVQPSNPEPFQEDGNDYVVFFILWVFWILIMARIVYRLARRKYEMKENLRGPHIKLEEI
jgi:hypothetical protein